MRFSDCRRTLFLGCALFTGATTWATVTLPFNTDFETSDGYTLGTLSSGQAWAFPSTLSTSVTADAFSGQQALSLTGTGWLNFSPGAQVSGFSMPVAWVDFYLKPIFAVSGKLPNNAGVSAAAVTGFVKNPSDGEVYVFNGNGIGGGDWLASGHKVALLNQHALQWMRISYRLDYATKRWDLFVDGSLVVADLSFLDRNISAFSQFSLRGDTSLSLLDYFYVGAANPLFADTTGDGLPDDWLQAHGLNPSVHQRYADPDHDGVDNLTEFKLGLSPDSPDSDTDGVYDRRELLWGANPKVADVRSLGVVPFSDGFEADTLGLFADGTRLWKVRTDASVHVGVSDAAGVPEGSQFLSISGFDTSLERVFADSTRAAVVWLDFYLNAVTSSQPPSVVPGDVAAVFYVASDAKLMALNGGKTGGGEWLSLGAASPAWHRVSVRMDYSNQSWSLWMDGVRRGQNLGFAWPVPYFSGFALKSNGLLASGLDRFQVRHDEPIGLDNDDDGLTNSEELTLGTNPEARDTDGDGIWDKSEIEMGMDPLTVETYVARLTDEGGGTFAWRTHFAVNEGYLAGDLQGQMGWQASGATVTTDEQGHALAGSGSTSVMDRYLGSNGIDQVWVGFRARLSAGKLPESSSLTGKAAGLFAFRHENVLAIYDSSQAKWVDYAVPASAGDWNDYAIYFDYRAQRWMLVLNGVLVARDLPFRDEGLSTITRFRLLQQSAQLVSAQEARIDDIIISNSEPPGLDFDDDDLTNAEERALGLDPFNSDTDGDGLSDGWEVENGLNPKVGDASGDLDGDRFLNFFEFQHGLNPNAADSVLAGFSHWDEWQNLDGSTVSTLVKDARFPGAPNSRSVLAGLEVPLYRGNSYGTRLRAWLKPTVAGEYVVWIAGDDDAELWLSSDETPFARRRIAYTQGSTAVHEWEKRPDTQRSVSIPLEAGTRYYVEVIHKQLVNEGHVSVAWRIPGLERALVAASYLEAFPRFANDQDEDGLPDDWEQAHGLAVGSGGVTHGSYGDLDQDGVPNWEEFVSGMNLNAPDSDGDGRPDALEYYAGTSPIHSDEAGQSLAPWSRSSIGTLSQTAGALKDAQGDLWLLGNDAGPSTSGDVFDYVCQPVSGDFELIVSVKEIATSVGSFGLILRDGLDHKAPTAVFELQQGGFCRFYARDQSNGALASKGKINGIGVPASSVGYWIRLRRQGNLVSASYSGDGTGWTHFTGVNQSLPANCLLGFTTWNSVATPTVREITNIRLRLDGDGDGLYNEEEVLLGTAIDDPDTDDDGLSDYEEVIDVGTNALGADATPTEVVALPGSSGVPVKGSWSVQCGTLWSETPLGSADYAITVPAAGVYRVQLDIGCRRNVTSQLYFPFEFSVDGQFVQRVEIPIPVGESRSATVTMPWLTAGTHKVRVFFDNTLTHRAISFNTLRLLAIGGTDADQNGRPDWVDVRLSGANRVFEPQPTSFVSPVCIEGVSRFQSMMTVKREGEVQPHLGSPGMGWYANIPLSATAPTHIETSFENGALVTQSAVAWIPLNLLVDAATLPSGRLVVRKNDSIRVSSVPLDEVNQGGTSAVQIVKAGATLVSQALGTGAEHVIQYTFATAGVYTISTSYTSGAYSQAASVTVEVLDGQFAGNPLVGLNYAFNWKNALIGGGLVVETDNGLILDQATALSTGGQQFRVINQDLMPKSVVARAGQNGAVLARAELTALRVSTDSETSSEVVEVYSNGTKLIQTPIILSQLPEGIKVVVEIFVGGVTFEDGTVKKTFYAADFDGIGRNYLRFVYPAGLSSSYCHRTHVYIGTVYLGTL